MICTTVAWGSKCSAAMQASPVGCSRRCCKSVLNLASESLFFGVRSSVRNHPARALRLHHSVDSCSPAVYHFSNKYKPGAVWQAHRRMGTTGHGRRKKTNRGSVVYELLLAGSSKRFFLCPSSRGRAAFFFHFFFGPGRCETRQGWRRGSAGGRRSDEHAWSRANGWDQNSRIHSLQARRSHLPAGSRCVSDAAQEGTEATDGEQNKSEVIEKRNGERGRGSPSRRRPAFGCQRTTTGGPAPERFLFLTAGRRRTSMNSLLARKKKIRSSTRAQWRVRGALQYPGLEKRASSRARLCELIGGDDACTCAVPCGSGG